MLTAIIATHESERILVPTLAALVPGATTGLLQDVIVADANSQDATAEIADVAGCRLMTSDAPLGTRLRDAAAAARAPWLLFLRAGVVPDPTWIAAVERFIDESDSVGLSECRAAAFRRTASGDAVRPALADAIALLRAAIAGTPDPDQGLLIARRFYDTLGGHPAAADAETALIRRLGRRRIALLAAGAVMRGPRYT